MKERIETGTDSADVKVTEFTTFEAREAAFNAAVGHLIPARYLGPQRFWKEFRKITDGHCGYLNGMPAYITSNPKDCLAFGTVRQVLAAAGWTASGGSSGSWDEPEHLDNILEAFGLRQAGNQSLRTLSGGETVRLSLAKAMLASAGSRRLVIASPFCWLSHQHLPLLDKVLDRFSAANKPVDMFIMQGESRQDRIPENRMHGIDMPVSYLDFSLQLSSLKIDLGTPINAITALPVHAGVNDVNIRLRSPCLLVGDNGQGKSLVAKALCGAVGYSGSAIIESAGGTGRGRLLFQDVVTQTLLRSYKELQRIDGFSGGSAAAEVEALFAALLSFQQNVRQDGDGVDCTALTSFATPSLLAVKTMLIAVRLVRKPAALILDEPDWGLSRDDAISLVLAVISKAHQLGVPVILISHKPWWHSVAGSVLEASKTLDQNAAGKSLDHHGTLFTIDLRRRPAAERKSP